jgi:hypothetical protein
MLFPVFLARIASFRRFPELAERKAFLLRLDPAVWAAMERLAQRELRSVNSQIEFLLRDALARRGITPRKRGADVPPRKSE